MQPITFRETVTVCHFIKVRENLTVNRFLSFIIIYIYSSQGRHGHDHMVPMQSVPITIKVVSLNSAHGEVYLIQLYVIKFVSDLQQVSDFLRVFRILPPIKLTAMI
jgi:hypothetical protein